MEIATEVRVLENDRRNEQDVFINMDGKTVILKYLITHKKKKM